MRFGSEPRLDRLGVVAERGARAVEQPFPLRREPDQERAPVVGIRHAFGMAALLEALDAEDGRRERHLEPRGEPGRRPRPLGADHHVERVVLGRQVRCRRAPARSGARASGSTRRPRTELLADRYEPLMQSCRKFVLQDCTSARDPVHPCQVWPRARRTRRRSTGGDADGHRPAHDDQRAAGVSLPRRARSVVPLRIRFEEPPLLRVALLRTPAARLAHPSRARGRAPRCQPPRRPSRSPSRFRTRRSPPALRSRSVRARASLRSKAAAPGFRLPRRASWRGSTPPAPSRRRPASAFPPPAARASSTPPWPRADRSGTPPTREAPSRASIRRPARRSRRSPQATVRAGLTVGGGAVWTFSFLGTDVTRIDLATTAGEDVPRGRRGRDGHRVRRRRALAAEHAARADHQGRPWIGRRARVDRAHARRSRPGTR